MTPPLMVANCASQVEEGAVAEVAALTVVVGEAASTAAAGAAAASRTIIHGMAAAASSRMARIRAAPATRVGRSLRSQATRAPPPQQHRRLLRCQARSVQRRKHQPLHRAMPLQLPSGPVWTRAAVPKPDHQMACRLRSMGWRRCSTSMAPAASRAQL